VKSHIRTHNALKKVRNQILKAIPESEFRLIAPHLEFVLLPSHRTLHESHEKLNFVHFPNEGLISLVVTLKDGKTVEAGLLGSEGISGMSAVLGLVRSPLREIVQISGSGFRVKIKAFQQVWTSAPQLRAIASRYAAALGMQVAQTAACNRLHGVDQRLARWLLIAHDRVDSGTLAITHDFLGTMLGTDRPSVSLALGDLKRKGIIESSRGAVRIVSRGRLERVACECYAAIRQYHLVS